MQDEFENNLGMARRVKTFLEDPANKPIWFNQPPMRFTTRAAELYRAIDSFSSLAGSQSVGPKGSADQQNIYETALEDACYPLANALHEYYLDNNAADQAAEWALSLSDWRRMREQSLLGKAERLIEQLTNLTNNLPPKGAEYGINASAVTALSDAADNYGDAIGKPTARRAQRSALTGSIRPTWRGVREIMEAMTGWWCSSRSRFRTAGSRRDGLRVPVAVAAPRHRHVRQRRNHRGDLVGGSAPRETGNMILRVGATIALAVLAAIPNATAATISGREGQTCNVDANVAARVSEAAAAEKAGDHVRAISSLDAALAAIPDAAAAATLHDLRGSLYVDTEDLASALGDANEATRLNSRLAGPYQTRGRVYRRRDQPQKALMEYNRALELNPQFTYLYVNRAVVYSETGDYERAMRDVEQAIRQDPKLADAYVNRGAVYYSRGQYEKALADYDKALSLNPNVAKVFYNRSLTFLKTGHPDLALRDDNEAIRRDPKSPDGYYGRARIYIVQRDYRRGLSDLEKARQLGPTDRSVLNSLAWLEATCEDERYRDGKAALSIGLELCQLSSWKDGGYLDTLAAAYAENGDFDNAVKQQSRAIELTAGPPAKREGMQARLELYQNQKPFRDLAPPP